MDTERDFTEDVAARSGDTNPDDQNLSALGDPAHAFDQTNGIVDGLEGREDDQEDDVDGPALPPRL